MDKLIEQLKALIIKLTAYRDQLQTAPKTQNLPPTTNETPKPMPTPVSHPYAPFPPMIVKWANAIKKWEGSVPSWNNPGNIKYSTLSASWGAVPGHKAADGGVFAQFKTPQQGFDALCSFLVLACQDKLQSYHKARTLWDFTKIYAGNPPVGYINGIINELGVKGSTNIATFL